MGRTERIIVCKRCNRERPFFAKDFCRSCYNYERNKSKKIYCEVCNRDNRSYARKNICSSCVSIIYKSKTDTPEKKRARADKEKERRARLGDAYRESERIRNSTPERIEYRKKSSKEWYQNNKEHVNEQRKIIRKINPDAIKNSEQNRRARHKSAGHLSTVEWREILEENNNSCFYCHRNDVPMEQEHKIPLAKGGKHCRENVVPSCRSCNAEKYTKTHEEYMEIIRNR